MAKDSPPSAPDLHVAPSPHVFDSSLSTRRVMIDVLVGLAPIVAAALWFFGLGALKQILVVSAACLAFEALFLAIRGRTPRLDDCSALVTGLILGLSLPSTAPWYVGVVAALIAIGIGKILFGGLGMNPFNPAMVGRAFVMIAFSGLLGAGAYVAADTPGIVSSATPLTMAKANASMAEVPSWWALFLGEHNSSLGESSIFAALLGGIYLCWRRVAAWEIPVAAIAGLILCSLIGQGLGAWLDPAQMVEGATQYRLPALHLTIPQQLFSGAFLFGAFFIATDPVSSPMTRRGKVIFGLGLAVLVWVIRTFSGYPEGLMFAILLMNALVPLLNTWTIPKPVGWREAAAKETAA